MTLIAGVLIAPLAFAATETGTDTGTDTDTGTNTGTSTDTSTDGFDSFEGSGECGSCDDPAESVWIVAPLDGATVDSPVTVMVDASYYCECDDCGCSYAPISEVSIEVDGVEVAQGPVGSFELELAPGVHTLIANVYSYYVEPVKTSTPVTVTVTDDGGSSSTGDEGEGGSGLTAADGVDTNSGDTGDAAAEPIGEGGCSCSSASTPAPAWSGLALLGLLALRRRRT